ncbi:MAG: PAS domain-containing protein [Betaproteobacteria bacterium]
MEHDAAAVMLWTARPDLGCESVSVSWLDFTGMTREQALAPGAEAGWTRAVHPEDLARWLDTYVRACDAREPFELEYRLRRRDGEYRWVLERAQPRIAPGGLFLGYSGACVDIDERRRAQDRLARALERERRARVAADEAGRMREGFVASVLRELQPVTRAMATWAAQLRAELGPGSEAARAADSIVEYARKQERIIGSLLAFSSAQGTAQPPDEPLLTGVKVLVVDDDLEARDTMLRVLSVAGAETRAAGTAAEALDALGAWRPDVLLSDLALQGEDGYSLIRELRSRPAEEGGCLRAAALTSAHALPRQSPVAAGYDAELAKPIEPVALLATVARLAQPVGV